MSAQWMPLSAGRMHNFSAADAGADAFRLWLSHDRRQARWLAGCPVCQHCQNPIQDEYLFVIEGDTLHERCVCDRYRKENVYVL